MLIVIFDYICISKTFKQMENTKLIEEQSEKYLELKRLYSDLQYWELMEIRFYTTNLYNATVSNREALENSRVNISELKEKINEILK